MIHVLKVEPAYFEALRTGRKRFELRKEEEGEEPFTAGDFLALNEWDPEGGAQLFQNNVRVATAGCYTGRCLLFEILYVLRGHELQLRGTVILSLSMRPLCPGDVASIR